MGENQGRDSSQPGGGGTDRRADAAALDSVLRALQSFHERYVSDRAAGRVRSASEYAALFPGHEDVVRDHFRRLREEDPPVRVPSTPAATIARLVESGLKDPKAAREIGRGGMGAVFRVRDEVLQRDLAMKVILDDGARIHVGGTVAEGPTYRAGNALRRMLQEAQITAQLGHPGIVPVHELGVNREGRLFFTMKLVHGRTLWEIFHLEREGREGWTRTRALQVFIRICETLAFAHSKGVLHRDLKPSNVMVGPFGEVYVMDWGVAKVIGSSDADDPLSVAVSSGAGSGGGDGLPPSTPEPMTLRGDVLGTPEYMAPEQALGRMGEVDRRSDVYSIGAMLYDMITGRAPYSDPGTERSPLLILQRVVAGPPEDPARLAPGVPAELLAICRKAMARDQMDRYQTAEELGNDLHRYLEGRVVRAHRTGPLQEFRSWVRRNSAAAGIGAGAVTVVLCGAIWFGLAQREAAVVIAGQRDRARAAETAARAAESREHDEKTRAVGLRLAVQAAAEVEQHPALALQLAVEAAARAPGAASTDALYVALARSQERRRLLGHTSYVLEGCWSSDGSRVLTSEWGEVAILWDPVTGQALHRLLGHRGAVYAAVFSPDGGRAATVGADGTARTWDVASGRALRVLSGHEGEVRCAAWSPDGLLLATGGDDGTVRLWAAASGEEARVLRGHAGPVRTVAFSPGGDRLASISEDMTARLWDRASGQTVASVEARLTPPDPGGPRGGKPRTEDLVAFAGGGRVLVSWAGGPGPVDGLLRIYAVDPDGLRRLVERRGSDAPAVSGDGRRIAAPFNTGRKHWVERWDAADPSESLRLDLPESIGYVALDRSGRRLAGFHGFDVEVWALDEGRRISVLSGHHYTGKGAAFSPDDGRLLTFAADQSARIWIPEPPDAVRLPPGIPWEWTSPDGSLRLVPDPGLEAESLAVSVVDRSTGRTGTRFTLEGPVASLTWTPEGRHVIAASTKGYTVVDALTGRVAGSGPPGPSGTVDRALAVSADLSRAARRGPAGTLSVIELATGKVVRTLDCPAAHRWCLSPDGRRLLTADAGRMTATMQDVETGKILHVLSEHGGFVLSVAWSPDGELVATSAVDSVVRIWDAATGAKLQTLGPVYAGDNRIGFGNGHRWVYTMAPGDPPPDGQVHVFDTATGERVTSLREPSSDGIIRTAWFLPGSNGIATCTGDGGLLRRWPADPLPVARERIPMEIEPEVVRKYEMLPEAEIEAYRDAWARRHPRVRTLVERALAVVAAGKADTALEWIAEARALDPRNPATDWGEARVRARRSELFGDPAAKDAERGLAVEAAARAIAGDIVSAERVRNDEWMAPLRGDPRFRAAVGE